MKTDNHHENDLTPRAAGCQVPRLVLPGVLGSCVSRIPLGFGVLALFLCLRLLSGETAGVLEALPALVAIPAPEAFVVVERADPRRCLVEALRANLPAFAWSVALNRNPRRLLVLKSHPQP